ncbi:MAG: hypothetical protein WA876_03065 [Candidatus Acidiferrales bacterium]
MNTSVRYEVPECIRTQCSQAKYSKWLRIKSPLGSTSLLHGFARIYLTYTTPEHKGGKYIAIRIY